MPTKNITLGNVMASFGCEDSCHEALAEMRWPEGVACIRCGSNAISRIVKRRQFECDACRYQFSVRVGTIFAESKLPLAKWFLAVYLMVQAKKGMSAAQVQRMLGVTYKTAWFLCHRIRAAMHDADQQPLRGVVEIDETYVGGEKKGAGSGNVDHKAVVVAAVSREGEVRARVLPDRRTRSIAKFVRDNIADDAEAVFSDEAQVYKGVLKKHKHASVSHSPAWDNQTGAFKREWVRGHVHTNTVEGVHSLLKRSIIGSFHHMSKKHLPRYVDEIEWRYNNRKNPYLFRDTMLELLKTAPMEYVKLTA